MTNNEYIKAYKKTQQSTNTVTSSHEIVRTLMKELVNSMQKLVLDIQDDRARKADKFIADAGQDDKIIQKKSKNLSKSLSIIYSLQTSLDFDKALEIVRTLSSEYPINLVNSVNPYRIQGQKTAAFEIVDDLGIAPDWLCIPMGNAGNITAYWLGFKEYAKIKKNLKLPLMMGFQSEGSAPLVKNIIVQDPETIATAIRIGNPVNRDKAKIVKKESKGDFQSVTDEEIIVAYKMLAKEGIFCEPASAASVAGLIKNKNRIKKESTIVCVLTGNGLKDPDCAIKNNDAIFRKNIEPSLKNITKILGY